MSKENRNQKSVLWDVVKESLSGNKLLAAGMCVTIIGAVLVGLIPPLILERMVNELTKSHMISQNLIVLYLLLLAGAGICDAGKEGLITVFGQKVTHVMRSEMSQKLVRLPAAYYAENESGVITSRFVNDVDTVETLFDSGIVSMFADGCRVLSILVIIFVKSKGLGLLMVLVTPVLLIFTLTIQKRMLKAQVENRIAVGKAGNHIPETIQNIRMIHTLNRETYMEKTYQSYIADGYQAIEKSNFYDAIYSPIIITISAGLISVLMICAAMGGGMQSFFGMSVGTAVAIISYVSKVFDPLESIGMEIQNIQSAVAGIYRIHEFLEEPERELIAEEIQANSIERGNEQDIANEQESMQLEQARPAISFEKVCFGYVPEKEVLHEFDFQVMEHENAVLTGRTGMGKSTAFKLLLGMYRPWSGQVSVYGVPACELSDQKRAALIGYVEQTFHMIQGTVRDQVTLKEAGVCDVQVLEALEIAGLRKRVTELPQGLDTLCTEDRFSQGQMQLLSIARAIVHNPPILLLDEITANLDSMTEKMVLEALDKASEGRTVLSISHRTNPS